eukprot:gene25377-11038_t
MDVMDGGRDTVVGEQFGLHVMAPEASTGAHNTSLDCWHRRTHNVARQRPYDVCGPTAAV